MPLATKSKCPFTVNHWHRSTDLEGRLEGEPGYLALPGGGEKLPAPEATYVMRCVQKAASLRKHDAT